MNDQFCKFDQVLLEAVISYDKRERENKNNQVDTLSTSGSCLGKIKATVVDSSPLQSMYGGNSAPSVLNLIFLLEFDVLFHLFCLSFFQIINEKLEVKN